jgi:hypothetical protein
MTRRAFLGLLGALVPSLAAPRWVWRYAGFRGGFDCGFYTRHVKAG